MMPFTGNKDDNVTAEYNSAVNRALNQTVWSSVRPVSLTLAILYIIFAVGHLLLLPANINVLMASVAGGTAVMFFSIVVFIQRLSFSERLTYPMAFAIFSLVIINIWLHLYLTEDILQTSNVVLVIFGISFFILSRPWFFATLTLSILSWVLLVVNLDRPANFSHFVFTIFSAAVISTVFHFVRTRSLIENEKLRLLSESQRKEKELIIKDLTQALSEIATLKGILPLCSFCKKIRDNKGCWEHVDVYIQKHSEADISHSMCPECMKKNYPEEYSSIYSEKND
jgi:hypothetical protein